MPVPRALALLLTLIGMAPAAHAQSGTDATSEPVGQQTFTQQTIDMLPVPPFFADLAALIPGAIVNGSGQPNYQDAGGSIGNALSRVTFDGGRAGDQMILLNGFNVGLLNTGSSATALTLPDEGISRTIVSYAAHDASIESGGLIVTLVPRVGSNVLVADLLGSFSGTPLQSSNTSGSVIPPAQTRVKLIADVNPALGTPIVRDRLWSFSSVRIRARDLWLPSYYDTDPADWIYIPSSRRAVDDERQWTLAEQATIRVNTRQIVDLAYRHERLCDCHWMIAPGDAPETAERAVFVTDVGQAGWHGTFGGHLLTEARASWLHTRFAAAPEASAVAPAAIDVGLGDMNIRSRAAFGPAGYQTSRNDKAELEASVSATRGAHAWRLGGSMSPGEVRTDYTALSDYTVQLENGLPLRVVYLGAPTRSIDDAAESAAYVDDRWTRGHISIYGGLRFDRLTTRFPAVTLPATPLLAEASFPAARVLDWNDLSPRLAVDLDPFETGRTTLTFAASRYVLQEGLGITTAADPAASARLTGDTRHWTDNFDFVPMGDPRNPSANGELGPSTNEAFGRTPPTRVDSAEANGWNVRPAQWELEAAARHEFRTHVVATLAFIRRAYTNFAVVRDANVSPSDYEGPFCIATPADPRLPGGGRSVCGLFDLTPAAADRPMDNVLVRASAYGNEFEHWNGADARLSARLRGGAFLDGGINAGKTVSDNCEVAPKLGNPSTLYCHVETPLLADVRIQGGLPLPLKLRVAATFQNSPGLGDGSGVSAMYVYGEIPSLGRTTSAHGGLTSVNLIAPGSRLADRISQLNVRVARAVKLGAAGIDIRLDVYNVLDANTPLTWNNVYSTTGGPSLSWLAPQSIMQGRLVEIGVRVTR